MGDIIRLTTDTGVLSKKALRVRAQRVGARTMLVRAQTDAIVGFVDRFGPRDTNRFANAVIQAGNDAGARPRPLAPLQESRSRHFAEVNLEQAVGLAQANVNKALRRVGKWEGLEGLYRSKKRTHHQYFQKILFEKREAEKELRFSSRRLESALTNQARLLSEEGRFAVTLGGFGRGAVSVLYDGTVKVRPELMRNNRTFRFRKGTVVLKRNIQVSTKISGGYGELLQTATHTIARLVNQEPHARIVESRTKVMKRAVDLTRWYTGATRQSKKTYLEQATRGTGWTGGRSVGR